MSRKLILLTILLSLITTSFRNITCLINYNALSGSSRLGTMQFQGFINGMVVQVLLDGGSSDNFIQPRLAHCLKLPIEPAPNTKVVVDSGHILVAEGLVQDLEVKIQEHSVKLPVYLLPVAGPDLVLGAAWLATLGPYISDYSIFTIKFYAAKLLGYDITIEYKPGKENIVDDSLSHSFLMAWSQPQFQILPMVREAIAADEKMKDILDLCHKGKSPHPNYTVNDNLLYCKNRLVVPPQHALISQILKEFHSSLIGGHSGFTRTFARIAQFYWARMHQDIRKQHSIALRKNQKLSMRYFGPFPIVERIGQVTQHLVRWQGLDVSQATWEDHSAMTEAFPTFNLEDKVAAKGKGIVTNTNEEGANMGKD
ncbi:Chromo-like domain superfamily [Sesbania bispinosa]|nr:Chromo-like domain superfamily [Sesbania bispinosa]